MAEATQFCISMEDKPGVLAKLCAALSRAKVNIAAIFVSHDKDCCWVNLVVSSPSAARELLTVEGYNFFTEKVLIFRLDDQPGSLERLSSHLSEAGVNISYVYGSCTDNTCTLVLGAGDLDRAAKVIGD